MLFNQTSSLLCKEGSEYLIIGEELAEFRRLIFAQYSPNICPRFGRLIFAQCLPNVRALNVRPKFAQNSPKIQVVADLVRSMEMEMDVKELVYVYYLMSLARPGGRVVRHIISDKCNDFFCDRCRFESSPGHYIYFSCYLTKCPHCFARNALST